MKLNEKILYYRKAAKMSQEELAVQIGVSRQAVSKWELGDATPEVDKLLSLARVFGVTTDELLCESEPAGAKKETEPFQKEPPAHSEANNPAEDGFDRFTGRLGRLVRRFGWLAGVYISLSGLGMTVVGILARWGFRSILSAASPLMAGMDPFGGSAIYNGSPELTDEIWGQMAFGNPVSPFGSFALNFATAVIVIGVIVMIVGAVLAVVLYRMGNKKP